MIHFWIFGSLVGANLCFADLVRSSPNVQQLPQKTAATASPEETTPVSETSTPDEAAPAGPSGAPAVSSALAPLPPSTFPIAIGYCAISIWCGQLNKVVTKRNQARRQGFMILPSATLGLVPVPFSVRTKGDYKDGDVNKNIGSFYPSIGVTFTYWTLDAILDVHVKVMYGLAGSVLKGDEKKDTYLVGGTLGLGAPFSIIELDIGVVGRRTRLDAESVSVGGIFLLNINLTGLGATIGSAIQNARR